MTDRIKPLKIESTVTGTETDYGPTEADPNEDYIETRGVYIQNDSSTDEVVLVTRNASDQLTFEDTDYAARTLDQLVTAATDPNSIHDNVASEISAVTEKASPVSGDLLLIEDSADSNNKKRVQVGNLPGGGGGETNTASNVGTAGVGVFKQKTGVDLELKKINAGSSKVTITDDTGNSEVDIDVVEANISHDNIGGVSIDDHHARDHTATHGPSGADALRLDDLEVPQDNTDLDATTSLHGLLPKLGGGTTDFLRADGTWATPSVDALTTAFVESHFLSYTLSPLFVPYTSGPGSVIALQSAQAGTVKLTAGNANGRYAILGVGTGYFSALSHNPTAICRLRFNGASNGYVGVTLTEADGNNSVAAVALTGANWFLDTISGGSTTSTDTGVALPTDTYQELKIVGTSSSVKLYIDGVLKATNTTNLPTATGQALVTSYGLGSGGVKIVEVDYYSYQCDVEA